MLAYISELLSWLACRFRSRAELELAVIALRHQLAVLRRQRPGRTRLFTLDRLLWIWLYRVWPRCLNIVVLVKPATVVQWHRRGFRLYWRWRSRFSRPLDRPRHRHTAGRRVASLLPAPRGLTGINYCLPLVTRRSVPNRLRILVSMLDRATASYGTGDAPVHHAWSLWASVTLSVFVGREFSAATGGLAMFLGRHKEPMTI
jgi:hypothetical protein